MFSLHYLTHAVCLGVIAILVRQYMLLNSELLASKGRQLYLNGFSSEKDEQSSENIISQFESNSISNDNTDPNKDRRSTVGVAGTSVWCSSSKETNRICQFKDLCYSHAMEEFIFFLSDISILENFNQSDASTLDMSSVIGHNMNFAKITFLPAIASQGFSLDWINLTSLIFSRFKTDNLMHVFHDDIIPMHHTLQLLELSSDKKMDETFNIQLVFFDSWKDGDFDFLYELFTDVKPLHKTDFQHVQRHDMTCFRKAYLGISKTTVWYDYGFRYPQTPVKPIEITSFHVRRTFSHIAKKLNISTEQSNEKPYLVMVSRSTNRLILNEFELSMSIIRETGMRIVTVNLERQDFKEVLRIISRSAGMIGIHGSLLILSLALKPGSILIELYPYAVNPDNYTPYRTLSELPGMHIVYKTWSNKDAKNTVGHPDWSSFLGGISHLPEIEQKEIMQQTDVPRHLCCEDASWLYHIYQDTRVDIPVVTEIVVQAVREAETVEKKLETNIKIPPSEVRSVYCRRQESSIQLSWKPPWNLPYLQYGEVFYEVIRRYGGDEDNVLFIIKDTKYEMLDLQPNEPVHIWIRCVSDRQQGPFVKQTEKKLGKKSRAKKPLKFALVDIRFIYRKRTKNTVLTSIYSSATNFADSSATSDCNLQYCEDV
ncbi:hypothetical protein ScPMuIL_000042 [Solemya velum]